jgi:uncharacterized circularly permuted ATP-grasp superfamily protein/uncharacterized alpha-E superfamily protein
MDTLTNNLLENYQKEVVSHDEIKWADGEVKPHWQKLFTGLEKMGLDELTVRNQGVINRLRENGVTYNVYESADGQARPGQARPWQLDPIPFLIEATEWKSISKGLQQRALLFDLMLRDIYGPRRMLKEGIIPPELIFDNTNFFRPCYDVKLPSTRQLVLFATDIARGLDGRMWVVDNRTESPSGMGYALENRSVMSKILPELSQGMYAGRLSPFFQTIQQSIAALSPRNGEQPNIVYLTPGSSNETYFEHAYLASYLGYTLVQGDDLLVRDGFVWLKSIDGLEKVDIIVRRIDDEWCDPLELREDSRLGVPGLLHAIRMGNVSVINPPGSSVLENSAFSAFLESACKFLLNEKLLMPSIATWWCGQPKELKYVLENLHRLIIKKANRKQKLRSIFGSRLSKEELAELRNDILKAPYQFIAQEEISLSTTPSFVNGKIEQRFAVMRSFLVSDGDGYQVMQGGLTRSSPEKGSFIISNQQGGISKDTWIVSDKVIPITQKIEIKKTKTTQHHASLPSRSAENLFWVGRYAERTMAITKYLKIVTNALFESVNLGGTAKLIYIDTLLKSLTHLTLTYPGFTDNASLRKNPFPEITDLIYNSKKLGTVTSNIASFLQCVIAASDKWDHDIWRIINLIESSFKKINTNHTDNPHAIQSELDKLHTRLFTFYGIITESMPRGNGYYLIEIGKLIERILSRASVLRATFAFKQDDNAETHLIESVLVNHHALVQYRQLYKANNSLEAMLDMVLLEKSLPYSVAYQLDALTDLLAKLPNNAILERLSDAQKAALEASTLVKLTNMKDLLSYEADNLYRRNLDGLLSKVTSLVSSITISLTNTYFTHTVIQHAYTSLPEHNNL